MTQDIYLRMTQSADGYPPSLPQHSQILSECDVGSLAQLPPITVQSAEAGNGHNKFSYVLRLSLALIQGDPLRIALKPFKVRSTENVGKHMSNLASLQTKPMLERQCLVVIWYYQQFSHNP